MQRLSPPRILLLLVFFTWMGMPLLGLPLAKDTLQTEKRRAAPLPSLTEGRAFPAAFERWWNDRFALRESYIVWHNRMRLMARSRFVSPFAGVLVADDGWLFYRETVEQAPLSSRDVQRLVDVFAAHAQQARAAGMAYVLVVSPNKASVYPDALPAGVSPRNHAPAVIAAARARGLDVLDLQDVLSNFRQTPVGTQFITYEKTDSHWNALGTLVTYRALMQHLAGRFPDRDLHVPEIAPEAITVHDRAGGDLADALSLAGDLRERALTIAPPPAAPRARLTVVLSHDSFGARWLEHLRRDVADVRSVGRPEDIFDQSGPPRADVLVEQIVERNLPQRLPAPDPD